MYSLIQFIESIVSWPLATPTTMQLIFQADSNSDLDERTTDYLFLELLSAGTSSLKWSCQLPVDLLHAKESN